MDRSLENCRNPASVQTLVDMIDSMTLVDLTHPLKPDIPVWPGHPHFCQEVMSSLQRGDISCWHALSLGEHTGTHFDAPSHFILKGKSISEVQVGQFFSRMVTIDAQGMDPRAVIEPERIVAWEAEHGFIAPNDAVFFHFGWDQLWTERPREFLADWPGLSGSASELLVKREVRVVGSDCLSIDCFASTDFPAHHALLGAGILIGENFVNLGRLPPICYLAALPLPIVNGSGAPVRAVAFVPR
jgi:arylformamidase